MAGDRILDFDGSWVRGSNSSMEPGSLPIGYAWHLINMVVISGVPSCRPGQRCVVALPSGNLQGCCIFRPRLGLEQMMAAVDGKIYVASYPFNNFTQLANVQFLPQAKQVFWMQTTQAAHRLATTFESAIEVIEPREVMIMQDGGNTAPAFYDGSQSGHISGNFFETPAGGPMEWVGDRLWVAVRNKVFASDISNPFSFREEIYLGGTDSFNFTSDVTAMTRTPSIEFPQLMVYTEDTASIIQADIRNRDLWPTTDGMQREVLQIGCASDRAIVSHFGRLIWFSEQGVVFYDPATARSWTSRSPVRDNEMIVSKSRLFDDLSTVAAGVFGQFVVFSVPVEDLYNKHTWVLNNASWETISDEGGPTWNGIWLGTRPVEWAYGLVAGTERAYHVSADEDGINRLWESFLPERLDSGCPITWAMFTRGYFGASSQVKKIPGLPCRMAWADVALAGVEEDLDLGIYYAGSVKGSFTPILTKKISVQRGSLSNSQQLVATTQLFALKPQSRVVRTEDANQQTREMDSGACPVETKYTDNIDDSFQLLVVGHGPATIRWIRPFGFVDAEKLSGDGNACEDEAPFNSVRFDGVGSHDDSFDLTVEELGAREITLFTANKTEVVSQDEFTAVGVGFAESIVSQRAADRVAAIVATKQAEAELQAVLPPVLSLGEGFE